MAKGDAKKCPLAGLESCDRECIFAEGETDCLLHMYLVPLVIEGNKRLSTYEGRKP